MESNAHKLLAKLKNICKRKKGNSLKDKLEDLSFWKKLQSEKQFIKTLILLVDNNTLVTNLLGYEEILYGYILKFIESKKYTTDEMFKILIEEKNVDFQKLVMISFLIGKKTEHNILRIIVSILNSSYFKTIIELKIFDITDNEFFIFLVKKNDINELKKEKEKTINEINIMKFITYNNDDWLKYYENIGKKTNKKKNSNEENNIINNEYNNINIQNINLNINNENNNITNNSSNMNNNYSIIIGNSSSDVRDIENNIILSNNGINSNEELTVLDNNITIRKSNDNTNEMNNSIHNVMNNDNIYNKIDNNNISNENNINNINEELIDNKYEEERINRMKELINNSLSIDYKAILQKNSILASNYLLCERNNHKMKMEDIFIDNYELKDETKLYLFSPVSLVANNIKKNFNKNDFELFNEDNHYIEMFGLYLEEIIQKLNSYINEGKDRDYIKNNKIKFARYNNHYYLCCYFNDQFKEEYFNGKNITEAELKNNDKTEDNIHILNIEKSKNNGEEISKNISGGWNKNARNKSTFSGANNVSKNYKNMLANELEKKVSKYILEKNSEKLQNIVFFFNLKIPKINNEEEIKLKSVRFSFSNTPNVLYGFREIDICAKNKDSRVLYEENVLDNNICYTRTGQNFKEQLPQKIDVCFEKDSIIFGEVKYTFPNINSGNQKCGEIEIDTLKNKPKSHNNDESNDKNNIEDKEVNKLSYDGCNDKDNDNANFTYIDQMDNLLKKAKLFHDFFINEKIIDNNNYMHILYLYDFDNIFIDNIHNKDIKKNVEELLESHHFPKEFKNIIFQIAYFDIIKYEKYRENIIKKLLSEHGIKYNC